MNDMCFTNNTLWSFAAYKWGILLGMEDLFPHSWLEILFSLWICSWRINFWQQCLLGAFWWRIFWEGKFVLPLIIFYFLRPETTIIMEMIVNSTYLKFPFVIQKFKSSSPFGIKYTFHLEVSFLSNLPFVNIK